MRVHGKNNVLKECAKNDLLLQFFNSFSNQHHVKKQFKKYYNTYNTFKGDTWFFSTLHLISLDPLMKIKIENYIVENTSFA